MGPPLSLVVLLCPSSLNLARALLIQSTWRFVGGATRPLPYRIPSMGRTVCLPTWIPYKNQPFVQGNIQIVPWIRHGIGDLEIMSDVEVNDTASCRKLSRRNIHMLLQVLATRTLEYNKDNQLLCKQIEQRNKQQASKQTNHYLVRYSKQNILEDQNKAGFFDFGHPNLKQTSNTKYIRKKNAQQKTSNINLTCLSATQT